jgi:hypothetical protein
LELLKGSLLLPTFLTCLKRYRRRKAIYHPGFEIGPGQ